MPAERAEGQTPTIASPTTDGSVERVFRDHNEALVRFIAARLGSRQDAREVAQEAYVRVLSLDNREAISYLRAFLFRTAANLVTDRLRARARVAGAMSRELSHHSVFELSPDREVEGREALERMRLAIDELPQKCRDAFLLYRIEELSCTEVAKRMQLQERMVWRYIARALEHIRVRVCGDTESSSQGAQE